VAVEVVEISISQQEQHMGAEPFCHFQSAKTASEAFDILVRRARHEHGHRPDSGTIAEKEGFTMVEPRAGEQPVECLERCQNDENHWSGDKRGPAACINAGRDPQAAGNYIFYFFGWSSI
jgi:hypothetical protein